MNLRETINTTALEKETYYKQWLYDDPLIIRDSTYQAIEQLHGMVHRVIRHFVLNYDAYEYLMPSSSRVKQIIGLWQERVYQVGTFRTDILFGADGVSKIIEITCRFSLNGYYLGPLMDVYADRLFPQAIDNNLVNHMPYNRLIDHLEQLRNNHAIIYVIVGDDKRNASKLYREIYSHMGVEVRLLNYQDLNSHINDIGDQLIIMELSLEELERLSDIVISALSTMNVVNDLRTILLIHDKRFFSVIAQDELLNHVLNQDEIEFFKRYLLKTHAWASLSASEQQEIKEQKNQWIIKHRSLGKSQSVYAGVNHTHLQWDKLINELTEDYTVQEWLIQQQFSGIVNGIDHTDYVTGTLLFFDEYFYGFGDFRTSSNPVINKTDHRKMCSVIVADNETRAFLEKGSKLEIL